MQIISYARKYLKGDKAMYYHEDEETALERERAERMNRRREYLKTVRYWESKGYEVSRYGTVSGFGSRGGYIDSDGKYHDNM